MYNVLLSCPAAQPVLPIQNQEKGGTATITVNPTQLSEQMPLPVYNIPQRSSRNDEEGFCAVRSVYQIAQNSVPCLHQRRRPRPPRRCDGRTDGRTDGLGSGREGHPWTDRAKPFLGRFTTKDEQEEKRGTEKEKERTKTISRNGHRRRLAVLTHRVFSTEPEIRNPSNGSEGHCQGT